MDQAGRAGMAGVLGFGVLSFLLFVLGNDGGAIFALLLAMFSTVGLLRSAAPSSDDREDDGDVVGPDDPGTSARVRR